MRIIEQIGSPGGFPLPAPTPPYMRVRVRRFLAVLTDRAALFLCHDGRCPEAQPVGFIAPGQDHRWSCLPAKFFTEHRGYHIFPFEDTRIRMQNVQCVIIRA
jgi:hypothetical protein